MQSSQKYVAAAAAAAAYSFAANFPPGLNRLERWLL